MLKTTGWAILKFLFYLVMGIILVVIALTAFAFMVHGIILVLRWA